MLDRIAHRANSARVDMNIAIAVNNAYDATHFWSGWDEVQPPRDTARDNAGNVRAKRRFSKRTKSVARMQRRRMRQSAHEMCRSQTP
jgi:hypothetical protein